MLQQLRLFLVIFLAAAVACKSTLDSDASPLDGGTDSDGDGGVIVSPRDLGVSGERTELTLPVGGAASMSVDVSEADGSAVALSGENIPAGMSVTFDPRETSAHATLTVAASIAARPGDFTLVVRARDARRSATTTVHVSVVTTTDFTVTLVPPNATVAQGDTVGVAVNVTRAPTFAGAIDIGLAAPPAGFTADPIVVGPLATSGVLNVRTSTLAAVAQTTTLSIAAKSGALVKEASLALDVRGRPGTLDTTFGNAGLSSAYLGDAKKFAFQKDGKILVISWQILAASERLSVLRLLASGAPDLTFGVAGVAEVSVPGKSCTSDFALHTSSGRIILSGGCRAAVPGGGNFDLTFIGLTPDGSLDSSFGSNGVSAFSGMTGMGGALIEVGSKIVATAVVDGFPRLVRLDSDGTPDATFGTAGVVFVDYVRMDSPPVGLVEKNGKLIMTGSTVGGASPFGRDIVVLRTDAQGVTDASFGTAGRVTLDFSPNDRAGGAAIQSDGKLVIAGRSEPYVASVTLCSVARLAANGQLDATFGNGGHVQLGAGLSGYCNDVAIQSDGKIVAVGALVNAEENAVVYRLTASGMLDTGFNNQGYVLTHLDDARNWFVATRIMSDGRIVAVGQAGPANFAVGVARFWP